MPSKRALVTGVTGQDGHYLIELLASKHYEIFGLVRCTNKQLPWHVTPIYGDITALPRDLPMVDEVYNLAALSHVGESFKSVELTYRTNAIGAISVMEWAASIGARCYQASTSEMFGNVGGLLDENSPMRPVSPYGNAKLSAHIHARQMRERGHYVSCGILFNHESPQRGAHFVTQKIARAAKRREMVKLGCIDSSRDWGHAAEYVDAMWRMLQQDRPDDYVIATGQSHTVKELLTICYGDDWQRFVEIDEAFKRPLELYHLRGNASKARHFLEWTPSRGIEDIMIEMMEAA